MYKNLIFLIVIIFAVSCGSSTIKVDPYLNDKSANQSQKKNCKDDCKGLKGQARADCNKRCN